MIDSIINNLRNYTAALTASYNTATDEENRVLRDETGKPMRDARDLPEPTETVSSSVTGRETQMRVRPGREIAAASQRPDTTYKVTHIDVRADYDFEDTFEQYFAVQRALNRADSRMPTHHDIPPKFLTDVERIKRLEDNIDQLKEGASTSVEVERLSPISFKITGVDASNRRRVFSRINTCLRGHIGGAGVDFYNVGEDDEGDIYVWAQHVYSYDGWRDEADSYREITGQDD